MWEKGRRREREVGERKSGREKVRGKEIKTERKLATEKGRKKERQKKQGTEKGRREERKKVW